MKAWHFLGPGQPLERVDIDVPVPGTGEVLVDIKAAGLCHSDVSIMKGVLDVTSKSPLVLGHEVAGIVVQIGPGVEDVAIGDPVGLAFDRAAAMRGEIDTPGVSRDGGFAASVIGKTGFLVPIPAGVSFAQAAAGTDAGMTAYHAIKVAGRVGPGMKVGIVGLGGLGLLAARIAVILEAEVYAAEPKEDLWQKARSIGVADCFADVLEMAPLRLDVICDFAGRGSTTAGAIEAVRSEGRVVQVGQAVRDATISIHALTLKAVELVGSLGGTGDDIAAVYALIASGQLNPTIEAIGFDDIPAGLDRLARGALEGRLVAEYP